MKKIKLFNCQSMLLVDDKDYEKMSIYRWTKRWQKDSTLVYATTYVDGKHIYAHHLLLGFPPRGKETDHKNGNGLDNRMANLHFVTHAVNIQKAKLNRLNKTGYRGVYPSRSGKWRAQIGVNNKLYHLGTFSHKNWAARAYNEAALKYFGPNAKLNNLR